jgi:hypothetical protein
VKRKKKKNVRTAEQEKKNTIMSACEDPISVDPKLSFPCSLNVTTYLQHLLIASNNSKSVTLANFNSKMMMSCNSQKPITIAANAKHASQNIN